MSDIGTRAPAEMVRTQVATHNAVGEVGNRMIGQSQQTREAVVGGVDQSDITDAMEEIGAAFAHRRKPRLEETKVRKGAGTGAEALGRIVDFKEKLPDQPHDQKLRDFRQTLEAFRERMEKDGSRPTKEDILEALKSYDPDPSHQFAALEAIRKGAVEAGAGEGFIALLDEARGTFREAERFREVTSGFAVARTAHDLAEDLGADPAAVRDAYRAVVREQQHLGQIFDHLATFNAASNFERSVDAFLKVAAHELATISSDSPTMIGETRQLMQGVVGELQKLKQMSTVFDQAKGAVTTLTRMHPELGGAPGMPDGQALTSRLLHFGASPSASIRDAERLVSGIRGEDPGVAVSAVNVLRDVHARMPDAAMPSNPARESQAKALLDLSSRLVAAEEAHFEAEASQGG